MTRERENGDQQRTPSPDGETVVKKGNDVQCTWTWLCFLLALPPFSPAPCSHAEAVSA